MKKILVAATALFFASIAYAVPGVWVSSNTATADTNKNLCGNSKALFHGVCVNQENGGTVSIFDARGNAVNPIAVIVSSSAVGNCLFYDVKVSSGLTYAKTTTTNATFLYQCGY